MLDGGVVWLTLPCVEPGLWDYSFYGSAVEILRFECGHGEVWNEY